MRTKRKTRVSFSQGVVDIAIPRSWSELTQRELLSMCHLLASVSRESVPLMAFALLSGMRVLYRRGSKFACRWRTPEGAAMAWVDPACLAELIAPLDFLLEPGNEPVRLDKLRKCEAVDAMLLGVPFGTYLKVENLYQGFLKNKHPEALEEIARLLYPGIKFKSLKPFEQVNVMRWVVQIKNMFSVEFSHFFQPAAADKEISMLEVMNCEVRALTGGDVTKEDQIMSIDCWRALTELDFLAKEAEESKRNKKS